MADGVGDEFADHEFGGEDGVVHAPCGELLGSVLAGFGDDGEVAGQVPLGDMVFVHVSVPRFEQTVGEEHQRSALGYLQLRCLEGQASQAQRGLVGRSMDWTVPPGEARAGAGWPAVARVRCRETGS
ncbi:hypothetical protein ADL28_44650 [Streptomyces violaceusniger]|uniref:Uncharacterized protein n=1 Tax=Streptomyces violaceusniger TaxID=68280 RepID=A0A0X3VD42_STRVO|nr:hypothetical protein ADL28_44650 [Streptomyces violaceusniger]